MGITNPFLRITGVLMLGLVGLRAGAAETTGVAGNVSEAQSVAMPQSSELRVVGRKSAEPVVAIAKRADIAPQIASPKAVAAPGPVLTATTDKVPLIALAKTHPTVHSVASAERLETVTERYPNGKVRVQREVALDAKGNYVNQGSYTHFDLDGQVVKTGAFRNGKMTGAWTQRFAKNDGGLFSQGRDGEFQGPFVSEATFLDGQLHGVWTIKDGNGQSIVRWSFEHGVRSGAWTWWHGNGNKRLEATYVAGALNGPMQEWDRDGQLMNRESYVAGKRLVKAVGWYTLGQKHYEGNFLRGENMPETTYDWSNSKAVLGPAAVVSPSQQHGLWISWYRNGKPETVAQYDHGVRVGTFKWFYENGQSQAEGSYEAGKKVGMWTTWHPNGLKESVSEYRGDQLVGNSVRWDIEGKRIDTADGNRQKPAQPQQVNASTSRSVATLAE